MSNAKELTDATFEAEISGSELPYLVDFWAEWCGPCRMMAPVLDEIAQANAETLKVGKVNVDENPETAAKFGVMSIPAFILFKNGSPSKTLIGAMPKEKFIEQLGL